MPNVDDIYQKTGRPKKGYYTSDGKRVPGVTTICKHIDPSADGLIFWAIGLERQGLDWKEVRDQSAREGTAVHDAVGHVCDGFSIEDATAAFPPEQQASVAAGLKAFMAWREQSRINLKPYEKPLVSDELRFGGTADLLGRDADGRLHLADIKTGSLRAAAVLQVAAYKHLIERALDEVVAGCHLLRFDRAEGAFTHIGIPDDVMDAAWEGFISAQSLYELNKRLRKML